MLLLTSLCDDIIAPLPPSVLVAKAERKQLCYAGRVIGVRRETVRGKKSKKERGGEREGE